MKKIYLTLALAGIMVTGAFAQVKVNQHSFGLQKEQLFTNNAISNIEEQGTYSTKGGTLWSEDFNGGFTTANGTWTTDDADGDEWKYTTMSSTGQYAAGPPYTQFTSTTAANGFMIFDSDSLNPGAGATSFVASLISPPIDLTGATSAQLVMEHDFRWCCLGSHILTVSVSSDNGVTWSTPIDLISGTQPNDTYEETTGGLEISRNITSLAAGNTVLLKFTWDGTGGNSHYYWTIDDISIVQAPNNDLVAGPSYWGSEGLHYYQIPTTQVAPIDFSGFAENNGNLAQTNAVLTVDVDAGATFTGSSATTASIAPGASDSLFITTQFTPTATPASYDITWGVSQTEVDEVPANNSFDDITMEVTNFMYARDHGTITGNTYNQGEGYEVGNLFDIWTDQELKAIDVRLSSFTEIGSQIYVKIYSIDGSGNFVQEQQSNYHDVVAGDLTGFITLDLLFPVTLTNANLTYLAVVASDGDGGATNDMVVATAGNSEPQTSFYYDATDLTWYYTTSTPMVRLNFDDFSGVNESEAVSGVSVYPNPASDNIAVNYSLNNASDVTIELVDVAGKIAATQSVVAQEAGTNNVSFETSSLNAGVYFVNIHTEAGSITKKFIKK